MTVSQTEELHGYLANQRWFAGKGRHFAVGRVRRLGWLDDGKSEPRTRVELVDVDYEPTGDGAADRETYQLPMAYYEEPQEHLGYAFVGEWDDPELGHTFGYDALHDKEATVWWLRGFIERRRADGLAFHRLANVELDDDAPSLVLRAEQSNTSLAFAEEALLKVFRKVNAGRNPDIEIHDALTRAGQEHVAALYGWIETELDGGEISHLAMLQQFLRTATDGWDLALTSVRDLFAEGDLHAEEVGGDFASESHRLGVATAQVHVALAESFERAVWGADELDRLAAAMRRRLEDATTVVPGLSEHAERLAGAYSDLRRLHHGVPVQRVHGDFHLGQTLRTVRGWKIIDFEGEPAKPLAERVALDSPMRDVAGMLRSLDYVAHSMLPDHPGEPQIAYRAVEWAERNSEAFLAGYAEESGADLSEQEVLLCAYETDKAVYEAVYESRNRPTWLSIPMGAIERMAKQRQTKEPS